MCNQGKVITEEGESVPKYIDFWVRKNFSKVLKLIVEVSSVHLYPYRNADVVIKDTNVTGRVVFFSDDGRNTSGFHLRIKYEISLLDQMLADIRSAQDLDENEIAGQLFVNIEHGVP